MKRSHQYKIVDYFDPGVEEEENGEKCLKIS